MQSFCKKGQDVTETEGGQEILVITDVHVKKKKYKENSAQMAPF